MCVVLSPMPRCDLVPIHFLQNRESFTHCTDSSSHTNTKSLLLSERPNHHHLSSASDVCQVTLKACHLSVYSGEDKAQPRACRMDLTRHPQTWVSPAQLSAGEQLPLYMGSQGLLHYFGEMLNSLSECFPRLHVARKNTDTHTPVALSAKLLC